MPAATASPADPAAPPADNTILPGVDFQKARRQAILRDNNDWLEQLLIRHFECFAGSAELGAIDPRWIAIAKTDMQRGLMALRRAVDQPAGF